MARIELGNADLSGAGLAMWVPPIDGLSIAAFVGDPNDANCLRNFGSGADLTVPGGLPEYQDDGFRLFDAAAGRYMTSAIPRPSGDAGTLIAVIRKPVADTTWGIALASSHPNTSGNGGRRGVELTQTNGGTGRLDMANRYPNGSGGYSTLEKFTDVAAEDKMVIGTFWTSGGSSYVQLFCPTTGYASLSTSTSNSEAAYNAEEADYPFRIGANYVGTASLMQLGFIGFAPSVLSSDDQAKLYAAVKKRFAALGATI
jgi:hypothetical protein